jgi:hypothetical protein
LPHSEGATVSTVAGGIVVEIDPLVAIRVSLAEKITFASHQNAVPVLRDLQIDNFGAEPLENLTVEISIEERGYGKLDL